MHLPYLFLFIITMRTILLTIMSSVTITAMAVAPDLNRIADIIAAHPCASADIDYEIMLPSAADPVTYRITLECATDKADSIIGGSYLIDWRLPRPKGESNGFAAYFDGDHFRFRDVKLQEYHAKENIAPFLGTKGIARQVQFADLVPFIFADKLRQMEADSSYKFSITEHNGGINIQGVKNISGYDALEFDYTLDATTMLPVSMDMEYNPASISEQTVNITFSWKIPDGTCPVFTEKTLMTRYPEVFDKFRTSNFHVLSMLNHEIPRFSVPTTTHERYTYDKGRGFRQPTLLAFLDATAPTSADIARQIRQAATISPYPFDVIYLSGSNDIEACENITGNLHEGETSLIGAQSLIRDCGINAFPTLLFCSPEGIIKEIEIGANQNLPEIVIQKMALCR